jgi:hypothetical protein
LFLDRGHLLQDLLPLIRNAAIRLDNNKHKSSNTDNDNTLYICWTYHLHGLWRQDIWDAYSSTLQNSLDYDRMTVAISRPYNLRDVLSTAALKPYTGMDIQQLVQSLIRGSARDKWLKLKHCDSHVSLPYLATATNQSTAYTNAPDKEKIIR